MWEDVDRAVTRALPAVGAYAISAIGLLFAVLWLWYSYAFGYLTEDVRSLPMTLNQKLLFAESMMMVGLAGGLIYAGYWFHRQDFSKEHQLWGAFWTMTGTVGIVAVVLVVNAHQLAEGLRITPQLLAEEVLLGGAGGGLGGLLIGVGMAQARRRSDRIADQRDAFEFLNKLLRHNILNSVSVIQGMSEYLEAEVPDEHHDKIETIQRRNASIAELTQNVRRISQSLSEEFDTVPVDLSSILRKEVENAQSSFESATFETEIPDGVRVQATKALGTVFDNLLTNAVVHNGAENPRVEVTVESNGDQTTVEVRDNGPGIPPESRDRIFEPKESADSGMGLYLADTLVAACDGRIDLSDREPRGTTIAVSLSTATADER